MTIPFHSSSKMLIGVLFTFSAVFQVSVNGAAMSGGAESNCSMPTEVAACASICNEEKATCLEFMSTSACICKSTPTEGQYRCEKGDKKDGSIYSDFPLMMERCEKIARSYSDMDYFLCTPKSRRGSDFMCAFNDRTEEHNIVKRARGTGKNGRKNKGNKNNGETADERRMRLLLQSYVNYIPKTLNKYVNYLVGIFTTTSDRSAKLVKYIPKTIRKLFNIIAGTGRRRRSIEF